MQFANVDNKRAKPSPGLSGSCEICGGAMIAKCGPIKVHHWAHRGVRLCDPWWENETPWHLEWKHQFPVDWQEFVARDATGEMHKADVRTVHGLTIEFHHSYLEAQERAKRERFYGNMIWVVDGSRVPRDFRRFVSGISTLRPSFFGWLFLTTFPDETFPPNWLDCRAPVILDFGNAVTASDAEANAARWLWCLLPGQVLGNTIVLRIAREEFLKEANGRAHSDRGHYSEGDGGLDASATTQCTPSRAADMASARQAESQEAIRAVLTPLCTVGLALFTANPIALDSGPNVPVMFSHGGLSRGQHDGLPKPGSGLCGAGH